MDKQEKLSMLRRLKEDRLRTEVLIPLFEKMGFKDVIEYHGSVEKGKDIIFYELDKFNRKIYTGVVVKPGNITGSVSAAGGAMTILNQIEQTFDQPYTGIYGLKELVIDRCMVITSRDITPQSIESICGKLKKSNLDKLVSFFGGSKVVDLLDQHIPDYFFKEMSCFIRYFQAMKADFEAIRDIAAIGQKEAVPLEKLYVSLKLNQETAKSGLPLDKEPTASRIFDEKQALEMERLKERTERQERVLDVEAAVKGFSRLVVVGDPGAGKTTLLKHLALKYCKENIDRQERLVVPIPITLRDFLQAATGLRAYIDRVFEKYGFNEAGEFVEKELKNGKCVLLLDGFDELATQQNQVEATGQILRFAQEYPLCRVIVTSRIAGYHDELSGFTRLELMDFDQQQMRAFIEHWFGPDDPNKAAAMVKAVKENENIAQLARNPLLMTIIAVIYEEDRKLPQGRAALYERSVDVLLSRWDKAKKLKNRFLLEKKVFFLRKLAYENHGLNRRTMSIKDIMETIAGHAGRLGLNKKEYGPFLDEIWQRSYLLRQVAVDTYDFLHLSFQEYFTALELREQADGIGTIISHIDQPWWEEPCLLYAGISGEATDLIKRFQQEVPEDIFYSNLVLAGKCLADAPFTDPDLREKTGQALWHLYEKNEFKLVRERAIEVLSRVKPVSLIDKLIRDLATGEDSDVRREAAKALGKIGSVEAIPSLIIALTTEKEWHACGTAAAALGRIGSPEAILPLIQALTGDKDEYVRRAAADALGNIGSTESIPRLIRALTGDKDKFARLAAADALGNIGSAEAIRPLIQALTGDKDSDVRRAAAIALGRIGSPGDILPLIAALTGDTDSNVRRAAAETLGNIGSVEAIRPLIAALTGDEDELVRGAAAGALGKIGSTEASPSLIAALTADEEWSVRQAAAAGLGEIGSAEAIPPLIQALTTDKNSDVRGAAANALGNIGGPEAIQPLTRALTGDKNDSVRQAATFALGRIGSAEAICPLIAALTGDEEWFVRATAAYALGKIGSAEANLPLIQALTTNKNSDTRRAAAEALGEIGSAEAIRPLIQALTTDEDEYVRGAAADALGTICSTEAIPPLIQALTADKDGYVRRAAATALGAIGSAEAIPPLIQALAADEYSYVRGTAAVALGKIGGPESIEPLIAALKYGGKDSALAALLQVSRRLSLRIPLSRPRARPK